MRNRVRGGKKTSEIHRVFHIVVVAFHFGIYFLRLLSLSLFLPLVLFHSVSFFLPFSLRTVPMDRRVAEGGTIEQKEQKEREI